MTGGQLTMGAKDRGAKDRGAKDRGANDRNPTKTVTVDQRQWHQVCRDEHDDCVGDLFLGRMAGRILAGTDSEGIHSRLPGRDTCNSLVRLQSRIGRRMDPLQTANMVIRIRVSIHIVRARSIHGSINLKS